MAYNNENSGVLFKNDRKETPAHPDYTGNLNVDGKEFYISAWIKEGKKGKFMSLSIKDKSGYVKKAKEVVQPVDDFDSDIPF